ncbi:hypothetical protein L210DRAFT_2296604 [Boletus edulis BED1]|uniref:Uncharacterized protein n=1 Tax=Boletus edulis BED1 TaxID=1328754 RepID=A0AAD4BQX2_BOLED|nr:hypothetical protein L210DRAFT_2296604 [Boletus edulis BED1]
MEDGAVLVLPEGAENCDLANEQRFLDEAIRHGVDWYECATNPKKAGRLINNDSLYLITGFHKACSWSLGAARRNGSGQQQRRPIRFKIPNHIGDRRLRRGVNQTVFIRGFRITVNKLLFLKTVSVKTRQGTFFGFGTYINHLLWGRTSGFSQSSETEGSTDNTVDQDSSVNQLYMDTRITIDRVPVVSQAFHPGDSINQYLLKKEPCAMVAVTHDNLWIEMLQKGLLKLVDFSREKCLEEVLSKNYQVVVGDVTLSKAHHMDILSRLINLITLQWVTKSLPQTQLWLKICFRPRSGENRAQKT